MFKKFSLILAMFLGLFSNVAIANKGHDELCPCGSSCEEVIWGSLICCVGCCILLADADQQRKIVYSNNNNAPRPQQMGNNQGAVNKDKNL